MEKIFESAPRRSIIFNLLYKLAGIFFGVISVAFATASIWGGITGKFSLFEGPLLNIILANWEYRNLIKFLVDTFVCIAFLWCSILFFFTLVIPIFSNRIKQYDLMSDGIDIVKKNNIRISILFSDIKSIKYYFRKKDSLLKWLYKEADRYTAMEDYKEISFLNAQYRLPSSYGVGMSSNERILVTRVSGFKYLAILLPWRFTLDKYRNISLFPSETKEFFDQLYVAYEKWKKSNLEER
jgi:hypothetical protein